MGGLEMWDGGPSDASELWYAVVAGICISPHKLGPLMPERSGPAGGLRIRRAALSGQKVPHRSAIASASPSPVSGLWPRSSATVYAESHQAYVPLRGTIGSKDGFIANS